jgi:biopolymer transport protein ExbB/TolQ
MGAKMFENLSFVGLLQKGGMTVIVLLFLSIVSIAIMLERYWAFRKFRKELKGFYEVLSQTLKDSNLSVAVGLCRGQTSPLAQVFLSGYRKAGKGKDEILRAMELAGRAELAKLERFLGILGTVGSTTPFIGLFGTVLGIIRAFSDMAASQGAGPAAVADGIAEALVATATGLFVAIPAVMAYNYFVRSSAKCALDLETATAEFTDVLLTANPEANRG